MTQDEIIEMARQAGFKMENSAAIQAAEIFANLVAAKEREACARVCEIGINNATDWDSSDWDQACENRAYHIRARGEA